MGTTESERALPIGVQFVALQFLHQRGQPFLKEFCAAPEPNNDTIDRVKDAGRVCFLVQERMVHVE